MLKNGVALSESHMTKSIQDTAQNLEYKVASLRPLGCTALGPGMITAIAMAGEGKPGS